MDLFSDSYRYLIEAFGFSKVFNLSKKVSSFTMALLEFVLEHESKSLIKREADLQEFADSIFGNISNVSESDSNTIILD